ncbi:hypothetical protein [Actinoplanes palleronii]|nr:hypothetical protein [Actinoplanes palleronii]
MARAVGFVMLGCLALAALQGCAGEPAPPWKDIGGSCPELTVPAFAEAKAGTLEYSVAKDGGYDGRCHYGATGAPSSFVAEFHIDGNGRRYTHAEVDSLVNRGPEEDGWAGAVELPRVGVPAAAYLDERIGARAWSENALIEVGFENFPATMATLDSRSADMTALLKDLLTGLRR